jgi:16S rRNA (guanine(966)-N(2))-methyltransferase RsmD
VDTPGLRPTPDRVRETLYNWLRHLWAGNFSDKSVLDLFAGTGALGFEAASLGAAHVQMVELNPQAVTALRALRDKLGAHAVRIHPGSASMALQRMQEGRFDLILLDPPFGEGWLERILPALPSLLTPDGLVYMESGEPLPPRENADVIRQGRAGQVYFGLIKFAAPHHNNDSSELP